MKTRELHNLGVPHGRAMKLAQQAAADAAAAGYDNAAIRTAMARCVAEPDRFVDDAVFGPLAAVLRASEPVAAPSPAGRGAPWKQWGGDHDPAAVEQMQAACRLPISVRGALMPDAHVGYGLPIGGVLATAGAVIPYAVGVDIACRMRLSVLDLPVDAPRTQRDRLVRAIESETRFGVGADFDHPRDHDVMDADWNVSPVTRRQKDGARTQLGTSGGGNHFVEFGTLTLAADALGLAAGTYLALLSHSGSRHAGHAVAEYYSKLAMERHGEMPKELRHLAWLSLASEAGQEYWAAMQLMGRYAAANHELIHRHVVHHLGAGVLAAVENHHNFAWIEQHDGREVVVHRKGATPAGCDAVGVIPGSMADPGFVVRGRGSAESLDSASHGAGRQMSRQAARQQFSWHYAKEKLAAAGVDLISGGLDEVPMAYKDIRDVMAAQADLVEILARFDPKLVKMAPDVPRGRKGRR